MISIALGLWSHKFQRRLSRMFLIESHFKLGLWQGKGVRVFFIKQITEILVTFKPKKDGRTIGNKITPASQNK